MDTTSLNAIADSIEAVVKLSRVAGHKACALDLDAAESIIASLRKYQKEIYHLQSQWQLCPKCHGQGAVSKPPGVGGDVSQWTSDKPVHECDLCHGKKVIAPPDYEALRKENENLKTEAEKLKHELPQLIMLPHREMNPVDLMAYVRGRVIDRLHQPETRNP